MGDWEIVVQETTTNIFTDPSFALADPDTEWNISGDGAADATQNTSENYFGFSSALLDIGGGTWMYVDQQPTVTATSYTLSARVRRSAGGTVSSTQSRAYFDSSATDWDSITELRDGWYLCVKTGTATAGARNFGIRSAEDGMYIDGLQLENLAYRTTYCDGDQPGCAWSGEKYTSTSSRSAQSRAGGRVYDLEDDLSAYAESFGAIGMPPVYHISLDYATIPGAEHVRTKIRDRTINLTLFMPGTDVENLHSLRQALIEKIGPEAPIEQQAFWLRYWGADVPKEIRVRYEAGLELGDWEGFSEKIVLRLWAEDPFWYALGQCGTALDSNDALDHLGVLGRLDGVWDDIGTPSAGGTVYAVVWGPDGCLYIGGDFTNWNGNANADYIAKWTGSAWSGVGTGMAGGAVRALVFDADGNLYAGGAFTGAGGVANTDEIAMWDGSNWSSLGGAATNNTVYALCVDRAGRVYAGGDFTSIGGYAIDRIARWDGIYWADVGGADGEILSLEVGINGNIFAGGDFTTIGNRTANRIAEFDGINWSALGTGCTDTVDALAVGPDGTLYLAGAFTSPAEYIAQWNGTGFSSLGSGYAESQVKALAMGPDGRLYAGGVLIEEPEGAPASGTGWWDPNGSGLAVWGAWRAKGASSYADTLTDDTGQGRSLTEKNGTPAWTTGNGWEIANNRKCLNTGFVPDGDQTNQTVIVQFASASTSGPVYLIGTKNSKSERLAIRLEGSIPGAWMANGDDYTYDAGALPTNIACCGDRYYFDGVDTGALSDWDSDPTGCPVLMIGALNSSSGLFGSYAVYIEGVAIYTEEVGAADLAAIENEMQGW